MRFATTGQLADLYYDGSRWAANKGLRRLVDAGLVRVWVPRRDGENVYSLAPAGRAILLDANQDTTVRIDCPRGLDGQLGHLVAINSARVALAVQLPRDGGEIRWWRSDWEIRGRSRLRAIPDAIFAVSWDGDTETVFLLEVDHHTRTPRKFLAKVLRYGARRPFARTLAPAAVLVVGADPQCIERYRKGLGALRVHFEIYFTTFDAMAETGAANAIWRPVDSEEMRSLRDLRFRPCGKEGLAAGFADFSGACAPAAARTSLQDSADEIA
jgi:hypothetical protein